jgi:hypothetical protein
MCKPPFPTRQFAEYVVFFSSDNSVIPARISHESPAATADMEILPGVLGCSFDRLRTASSCDVLFKYASNPIP